MNTKNKRKSKCQNVRNKQSDVVMWCGNFLLSEHCINKIQQNNPLGKHLLCHVFSRFTKLWGTHEMATEKTQTTQILIGH